MMAKGQQEIIAHSNMLQPWQADLSLSHDANRIDDSVYFSTPSYNQATTTATTTAQPLVPPAATSQPLKNTQPAAKPPAANKLSSEEIPKNQLTSTEEVLKEYSSLVQYPCKMTTLSVKLAREGFFGDTVMAKCTPQCWQDMPALPHKELSDLKMLLFKTYPSFRTTPEVFEKKWVVAQDGIG